MALWQAALRESAGRAGTTLDEAQESYLVFVLLRHQRDAQLLARTQALEWLRANACAGRQRADALRDVGDHCLLIAGLYPALAERRRVSVDYFVDLGRGAYQGVAEGCRDAYAALFAHLAAHYHALVRTLRGVRPDLPALALALAPAPARPLNQRMH